MLSRIGRYALVSTLVWAALIAALYGFAPSCPHGAERCDRIVDYAAADKQALQRLLSRP